MTAPKTKNLKKEPEKSEKSEKAKTDPKDRPPPTKHDPRTELLEKR